LAYHTQPQAYTTGIQSNQQTSADLLIYFLSTGGSPPYIPDANTPTNTNEPYLDWLNYVLAQPTIPQTFTTSYGDDEQTVPLDYATSVCNMFAQLGTRGASVLFSSGDSGVGGGSCTTFLPNFPASCEFFNTYPNYT
jgi:tripeptidyl-peptidase-1